MSGPHEDGLLAQLASAGDLAALYQVLASVERSYTTLEQWWQGEFHLDLVLGARARTGPCLVVASN